MNHKLKLTILCVIIIVQTKSGVHREAQMTNFNRIRLFAERPTIKSQESNEKKGVKKYAGDIQKKGMTKRACGEANQQAHVEKGN